jgi:thiamine biosynthesis lipoprotein
MSPSPRRLSAFLALLLPAVFCTEISGLETTRIATETRVLLGTVVTVTVSGPSEANARTALRAGLEAVEAVDREMARNSGTPLWKLNQAGGGQVSPELAEVIDSALQWARRTGGLFDPTVAPLLDLWDLLGAPHAPPSESALREALGRVGWTRVRVDRPGRRVELGGTSLDLGGIAKGFALDRAAAALRSAGARDFLIDAGGDVCVAGKKGGRPWRVGIQDPHDPGALLRVVEPAEGVLLTSGDYQRGFDWNGQRYHHLMNPRTGQPSRGCRSVTLWAPRATAVPSAAVFLLGPAEGMRLVSEVPGVEALIVDSRGEIRESKGFSRVAPASRGGR